MWRVYVPNSVQKSIARLPAKVEQRMWAVLDALKADPHAGDVEKLAPHLYRRRDGNYRIIFERFAAERLLHIRSVARRTSTTYRKR